MGIASLAKPVISLMTALRVIAATISAAIARLKPKQELRTNNVVLKNLANRVCDDWLWRKR